MKLAYFLFLLILSLATNAQENNNLDKREIFFYVFDSSVSNKEVVTKSLGRNSDSLLIKDISFLTEKQSGSTDTIICKYSNNTIFFTRIDTLQNKISQINLSVKFCLSIKNKHFIERLTFPYKPIFEQTNATSNISISFERKRNNLYRISISKLDYPFIVSTYYLPSEIIGLYQKLRP